MSLGGDQVELARREAGWRRGAADPHWVAEQAWKIQHPLGERLFTLRASQSEALQRWLDGENSITLKARQIGWSTLVAFYVFWLAFWFPNTRIMLLSKGEREAQELLGKVKFGLERIPGWLQARGPRVRTSNLTKIELSNGSEILSLPSGNNPARGFTGRLIVVDEFAFLENAGEAWASIEPTADIGGQLILLSTANGSGNKFEDLWVRAQSGKSVFKPMFYGWDSVYERDEDWYKQKQFDLPEWQLHQEYPSNPSQAFIRSGMMVFNSELLEELNAGAKEPLLTVNLEGPGPDFPRTFEAVPNTPSNSFVHVWEEPDEGTSYVIGADVAEGLAHGDYSSGHVVSVGDEPRVVAEWHGHIEADLFAYELFKLGTWYNTALILPEVNNHGLTTVTELRKLGYRRIWRRMSLNSATRKRQMEWGWKTTRITKPLMIDGLHQWMRVRRSAGVPSVAACAELARFTRNHRGQMSGSPHDDRVISLALAVHALDFAYSPEYQEEVVHPYGSMGWYEEQVQKMDGALSSDDEWVIH
mgnify:FL=1